MNNLSITFLKGSTQIVVCEHYELKDGFLKLKNVQSNEINIQDLWIASSQITMITINEQK